MVSLSLSTGNALGNIWTGIDVDVLILDELMKTMICDEDVWWRLTLVVVERLGDSMIFSELSITAEVSILCIELVGSIIISVDEGSRSTLNEETSGLILLEKSITFLKLWSKAELDEPPNTNVECSALFEVVGNDESWETSILSDCWIDATLVDVVSEVEKLFKKLVFIDEYMFDINVVVAIASELFIRDGIMEDFPTEDIELEILFVGSVDKSWV